MATLTKQQKQDSNNVQESTLSYGQAGAGVKTSGSSTGSSLPSLPLQPKIRSVHYMIGWYCRMFWNSEVWPGAQVRGYLRGGTVQEEDCVYAYLGCKGQGISFK
jgi:hypothetical protein